MSFDMKTIAEWLMENNLVLNLGEGKTDLLFGSKQKCNSTAELNVNIDIDRVNQGTKYEYLGVIFDNTIHVKSRRLNSKEGICPSSISIHPEHIRDHL